MGIVPGEPTDVFVTEATKSYVVLAWKPPVQRGHEGVMYYIEKVSGDADLPTSLNNMQIDISNDFNNVLFTK